MSSNPNVHAALIRNRERLHGRIALIGAADADFLPQLAPEGLVVTDHAGLYQRLGNVPGWTAHFGYFALAGDVGELDTVVLFMPKAKAELGVRLQLAASLLRAGGQLLLLGEKREGIASAVKHLQSLVSSPVKVDSARHCQVWQATVDTPQAPPTLDDWLTWHPVAVADTAIDVAGLPGVFSNGRLDDGTAVLLKTLAESPVQGPVLDFACGAGVIGAWLQSHGLEDPVDGIDVQAQAVACARETYRRNGARGTILAGDGLDVATGRYAAIVTNPPFHSGVRTDTSMTERFLAQAADHLSPGGELRLVANSFLPYRELIERHIGPCDVLRQDGRFSVYRAKRH